MANRFWVGNSGNINDTAHWSTSSGGAGGASVPILSDNAIFDSLSFTLASQTVTVNATFACLDMDWSGVANSPTLGGSGFVVSIYGNLTLAALMSVSFSNSFTFASTSTGKTITTNGVSISSGIIFDGVGGGWTLQDNLSTSQPITLTNGGFNTNGKTVACSAFQSTNSNVRTLTLGASVLTLQSNWVFTTITNLTFNVGTSTINMAGVTKTFDGGGLTYNNVSFTGTPHTVVNSNTFNVVTLAAGKILNLTAGTTQTLSSFVSNGTSASPASLKSLTASSAATISTAAAISTSFLTVQDITKAGVGTVSVVNGTNVSGNTGITFTSARYWVVGTGNTNTTASWAYSSGGSSGATIPTSADSVYFDANSFSGAGQIVTVNAAFDCLDMDWSGATNAPTMAGSQNINVYGSLTLIAAMTSSYTGVLTCKSTTTGKTITTNGRTLVNSITFDGVGGGWTLQDAILTTLNITLTNGSLNTNGKAVGCTAFNGSNTNIRTLTLGASIITVSGGWTFTNGTNLTLAAGTSTIVMTGTASFTGNLTYNNLTISGSTITLSNSNTFNVLTINAGKTLKFNSSTTQTVTSLVCNGTTASPSTLQSTVAGTLATIALPAGRYFIRHTSIKDITVTGATSTTSIAGTNVSGNTGITFVTKFEMGRIKNDGSFNWYSAATGAVTKVSG